MKIYIAEIQRTEESECTEIVGVYSSKARALKGLAYSMGLLRSDINMEAIDKRTWAAIRPVPGIYDATIYRYKLNKSSKEVQRGILFAIAQASLRQNSLQGASKLSFSDLVEDLFPSHGIKP